MSGPDAGLTPERLAELERLEREATPCEWTVGRAEYPQAGMILTRHFHEWWPRVTFTPNPNFDLRADADLIAALRNAAPALLRAARERDEWKARAERAEGKYAALRRTLDEAGNTGDGAYRP